MQATKLDSIYPHLKSHLKRLEPSQTLQNRVQYIIQAKDHIQKICIVQKPQNIMLTGYLDSKLNGEKDSSPT